MESVNSYLIEMLFLLEGNFAAKYSINALYVNNITWGMTHNVTQKRDVLEVERCKAVGARDFSPENMNASNVPCFGIEPGLYYSWYRA